MRRSNGTFADLRRLLLELGFRQVPRPRGHRFEQEASETVLFYRLYEPNDLVTTTDLSGTRHQLVWRGLLPAEAFEDRLKKAPA